MEIDKIKEEYAEIMKLIADLKALLADAGLRYELIKTELREVQEKFGDERRSEITYLDNEMRLEDLIKDYPASDAATAAKERLSKLK